MRLKQLQDFVEIVDAGGIRAAARQRGVSQPVLTKSLRSLETAVGVRLLHRTTQGILLTPAGRALLARTRAAQKQLSKALEEIAEITGSHGGSVAFGASATGLEIVPKGLARFQKSYSRSYVRVVEGSPQALLPLLRDESLDFFIGPRQHGPGAPQVHTRPLFRLPLAVAGRRQHPRRRARHLAALRDLPWLLFSAAGWNGSHVGDTFLGAGVEPPSTIIQCESFATAISLLTQTDTLGLFPRSQLRDSAYRSKLEEIPVDDPLPTLAFSIYLRADDTLTRPAAALSRALLDVARDMMAEARLSGTAE